MTNPYPPQGYGQPAQPQNNALGLAALIVGIASIPLVCCWPLGLATGIAGVVLSHLGKQKAAQGLANNRGQAHAGFICGIVGTALAVLSLLLGVVFSVIDLPTPGA
ncbi:DUF4190 domain-containing protein [Asanoa siamensis]|uniref:DUF4190 domain-containing protein n=1 Tax=Asanoa siamensis TaxID=926357 RepID=A0ABQ4D227_9ACTN|nr:DUF4190 domain-containing protein [Asanoa siamensis]GIF77583.1 hypothetical protein Asi02nite_71010 [Asanoa siamensis]